MANKPYTLFMIAGERSGDLHGANLIREFYKQNPEIQILAYGGELMQAAGAKLLRHYHDFAIMGFVEVLLQLQKVRRVMKACKADLLEAQPDAVVLIDFGGFNLRIARFAKQRGIKTFYYISPKVWAWNQRRALNIKAVVDRLFVIFPFEVKFFEQYQYRVDYVGNPLLDAIAAFKPNPDFKQEHGLDERPIIALLPGSRKQEVDLMLPIMLQTSAQFGSYQYVIATVSNLSAALYGPLCKQYPNVKLVQDAAYDLLSVASAALVTSGTATLETALFGVPQVVCYKTHWMSYQIAKRLIRVPFISLVNLIANKEVVKELIQHQLNRQNLCAELEAIVDGGQKRNQILINYAELRESMGTSGASAKTAALMLSYLA